MEQFNGWSFSMRKIHKAQPAGEAAYMETKSMDEGEAPKIHTLKVADDPEELDALPEWMDGNDLISCENEAPEILIAGPDGSEDGAILRRGSKLVVGGSSKMGKTWSLIDLGLAVAAGGKWLGHFQCRQGMVLYVNLELRKHTAGKRMRWIGEKRGYCRGTGLRPEVSKAIKTWNLRGQCYDLVDMLSTARMRLKDKDAPKFSLIILDPIYKTYGDKDENSAGDMAALMLEIERFADECNAAIAFAAHFSKGNQSGKEAIDRISGSGVMARDPDAIITFTNHEEEDCYTLDAVVREFPPVPPAVMQWDAPVMCPRVDLDPTKLRQPGKIKDTFGPRAEAIRQVLEGSTSGEMGSADLILRAKAITQDNHSPGVWKQSINRHMHVLAEYGVEKVNNGTKQAVFRLKKGGTHDPF
jgi:hypothetical protein